MTTKIIIINNYYCELLKGEKRWLVQQKSEEKQAKAVEEILTKQALLQLKDILKVSITLQEYPARKNHLIKQAQNNGAPDDVMNVLNRFEDKEYGSTVDVAKEVGNVE